MIPGAILLILLVVADAISHITLWLRERQHAERTKKCAEAVEQLERRVMDLERELAVTQRAPRG